MNSSTHTHIRTHAHALSQYSHLYTCSYELECTLGLLESTIFMPCFALVMASGGLLFCQIWLFYINKTTAEFFHDVNYSGLAVACFEHKKVDPAQHSLTKYDRMIVNTSTFGLLSSFLPPIKAHNNTSPSKKGT
eukprot:m.69986 g.69986  ORF g.69986 m.69986 type:complete len:134 (-) comp8295_c0_seq1:308-709(-)